jgi:hypothetical protein
MTENKRARHYWVKATGGQLKVPVEINSNEFDNIDLTTGDDRWIYTVIQTVDPTTNPTSMKQKWLHLIEFSEVQRLEWKDKMLGEQLAGAESTIKELEDKLETMISVNKNLCATNLELHSEIDKLEDELADSKEHVEHFADKVKEAYNIIIPKLESKLKADLKKAVEALESICGNECAYQNPCEARSILRELRGEK